jgi:sarcosine oxidase gamma subunit
MLTVLLAVLIGLQLQPAVPPRDSSSRTGGSSSLTGRITEQATGRPLPRALVTLMPADRPRPLSAVADAQGRYEFTDVQPGEYVLWAEAGEHRSTHLRQAFGQAAPFEFTVGRAHSNIRLNPGEARSGVDMALARALAIEGRVSDAWDDPMADVEVTLTRADGAAVRIEPGASDDRGEYRLFGVAPGRYRVCAAAPNTLFSNPSSQPDSSSRLVRTCHPASPGDSNAADVILVADDARGIDIRMQRSGTYSVAGSVHDAAGALVQGARVSAMSLSEHSASSHATTREGSYLLPGLTRGRYLVQAFIGGPANPGDTRPPARELERGYAFVDVDSADVGGLDLSVSKATKITGRVVFKGDSAPGPTRWQMIVHLRFPVEWPSYDRPPFSPVDGNLAFELSAVSRVPQAVGISGLPDGWVLESVRYGARDILDVPVDFGADPAPARLDLVLTNKVAATRVRVTEADGSRPAISYHVILLPRDPARWQVGHFASPEEALSDGVLSLGPHLPGEYLIAAIPSGDYGILLMNSARIASLSSVAIPVTLVQGANPVIELRLTRLPPERQ